MIINSANNGTIVITSIQSPTSSVCAFANVANECGLDVAVIGDVKTPTCQWPSPVTFLSFEEQADVGFRIENKLPRNHYARKNIGYLMAMRAKAPLIYDTDDDNAPMTGWTARSQSLQARRVSSQGWVNAYAAFHNDLMWPRGLPLEHLKESGVFSLHQSADCLALVQQGLADGSPDVDAIWRMTQDRDVRFRAEPSIYLAAGTWCPFNSQSTWWFPDAYPLLYLPSFVSFRMTDIWRSFVAQRCLWELSSGVAFVGPEVEQVRNEHNLFRDFEQEVPGYLHNSRIRSILEDLPLKSHVENLPTNLMVCYEALIAATIIPATEIPLLEAWLQDCESIL